MQHTLTTCLGAICILAIAGCSSTPTKVDKGPIQARTFQFVNTSQKPLPAYAEKEQQVHSAVQTAITESLARRSVTRATQGADITVGYLLIAGNGAATTMINDYFGYGRDAGKLLDKAHDKYTASANPNYFEAGTLVIDIIDSKTWKLVKRGHATRELLRNAAPEQRVARIKEVVEEILRDVKFEQ